MASYVRQLLAGRDFAQRDPIAAQMANFVYLIGDSESRECVLVDPAWDPKGLLDVIDRDEWKLTGVLATHYHPDHVGGEIFGFNIKGIVDLVAERPVKIHVNEKEAEGLIEVTGLSKGDIVVHRGGDILEVGGSRINFLHTPGHTPGSQCFLVDSMLVSGDTLFIDGCGRVDLPGGNAEDMYHSLTQVLAKLDDETVLYPGHNYSLEQSATMDQVKQHNHVMRAQNFLRWKNG